MAAVAESFIRAGPEGALPQDVANTLWALAKVALLHRRFLQMVGKAMCARLWEYDQQNLSNILWSFAALAVLDRPLVALATSAVAEGPLRPQTLSNTAWALATLEMLEVALMERLGERSLQVMGEFKVQELVNTAWAFATSALITLPLLAALAKAARRWPVEALQPQDIAGLAWSLAVCSFPDPSLFDAFAACSLEGFGPQDLANTAWAFAAARVQAGPLMRRIGEASALQIAHFDAQDLANAMWAFAKLEERPPERLWCSWPDQVFQTLQEATLQNLAMTTWSIATLGSPTPALLALMPKVAAEAALRLVGKRILPNRSALQEISNLLWSFPTLELSIPEELLTISEQHLQKTLPQQLAQVLCQVQKETAQEPQEAFDFATSILELTWALAFSGDGDGPRGALLTLLRNTLMEVAEALDRTSQWWLRRLDSSRSSGRFWPESGRTCDEELPRREELEWPVLQLNLPEVAVVLKPPYWEVDAHAPTTAPDATAPHDAKLSSFLQGVEGWEDFPLIFSEEHQFGILHRLDLPSSGLILVGKTFRGYFSLRWQQDTYDLGRNYLVLCHGVVEEQVVNARLKTTKSNPVSSCVSASGKPAWTHFQPLLLLSRGTEKYTLLIVVIRTGRTHQIRVHAQHIGHPTVADTKYGGALAAEDLRWCPRNFLHRFQLRFQDPAGRPHTASAPLPGDLRAALARLRAEGAEEMWRKLLDGWIP